jgi:hypothetical protein
MTNMKHMINVSGQKVRRAVMASAYSKEQVVAHVQDKGLKFSLTGLDKIYRNELPVHFTGEILAAIAEKCGVSVSDFGESEAMTA